MNIHRKLWEAKQLLRLYLRLKLSLDLLKFRIVSMTVPGYEECFKVCFSMPLSTCMPSGVHIRWTEEKSFGICFEVRRRPEVINGHHRGRCAIAKRGGRYARRKS